MNLSQALRYPLRLIPDQAVLPVLSGPLRGAQWIVGSGRKAYWFGTYESHFQRLLCDELDSRSVFFDIGANAGFYSLLAARMGAAVFAFEPFPANAAFVRRHAALNRFQISVQELALSNYDGIGSFVGSGAVGHIASKGIPIKVAKLDSLISAGLPSPSHIKMDIEGAELEALRGAEHCIRTHRPKIFLAVHSQELHKDCVALLSGWSFSIAVSSQLEDGRADLVATP